MTPTEARETLLRMIAERVAYWAAKPDVTPQARCASVASEILCMLDGTTSDLPAIDLILPTVGLLNFRPMHPEWSAMLSGVARVRDVDGAAVFTDRGSA